MDYLLMKRLDILNESDEVDEDIKNAVVNFAEDIEKEYSIVINEENGAMLITHVAMALSRIKRGEKIDSIDEEIFNQVKKTKVYSNMPKFYENIEKNLDIKIPESEKGFIALHLCTLIMKEKNEEV